MDLFSGTIDTSALVLFVLFLALFQGYWLGQLRKQIGDVQELVGKLTPTPQQSDDAPQPEWYDLERRTREARLLVAAPEIVAEELKAYGAKLQADKWALSERDADFEKLLLERGHPLIDLALASYASDASVVTALYKKGAVSPDSEADARYKRGLRISCLSNPVMSGRAVIEFEPEEVFGRPETLRLLSGNGCDWEETEALICNPSLSGDLLVALYQREKPFSELPERQWLNLVAMSAKNRRLITSYDDDDYPDLSYSRIHEAIFRLLLTAPLEIGWMLQLHGLLLRLNPKDVPKPDSLEPVLRRWSTLKDADDSYKEFRERLVLLYGRIPKNRERKRSR